MTKKPQRNDVDIMPSTERGGGKGKSTPPRKKSSRNNASSADINSTPPPSSPPPSSAIPVSAMGASAMSFELDGGALDQQDVVIKGIVHDVNNNLMAIMAACDQLETRHLSPVEIEIILSTIRTHVNSATGLMRDLGTNRDMGSPVVMTARELRDFFHSILPSLSLLAGEATRVELGPVVTPPVQIHPLFLHRIMMQFIRNVADLNIDYPLAYISIRRVGEWCEVSVADNGPGLQGVTADNVFLPGVTSKGNSGSRGYGLSAVAWAVNKWNGEYGVEHIEGDSGCRFWVRIPLELAASPSS